MQPTGVVSKKRISRPEALSMLLKDRKVPRFIVAPEGYGKTHVAFEYASMMFAFKHVFWVRCSSPCYLRDLDAGTILEDMMQIDSEAALVIFDGLPHMDPKRVEEMSGLMDALLDHGCEVMVTCQPTADCFSRAQLDRICIYAADLMLSDLEVDALGLSDRPFSKIPCIAWGEEGEAYLLRECAKEVMPSELKAALFLMMVLNDGSAADALSCLEKKKADEACKVIERHYTFIGLDLGSGSFSTLSFKVSELKAKFMKTLADVSACTAYERADELVFSIVEMLMDAGEASRSEEVLTAYATQDGAIAWLSENGWRYIWEAQPLVAKKALGAAYKGRGLSGEASLMSAWASWSLSDERGAISHCKKAIRSAASADVTIGALATMAAIKRQGMDPELALELSDALRSRPSKLTEAELRCKISWTAFAAACLPLTVGDHLDAPGWGKLEEGASSNGAEGIACSNALGMAAMFDLDSDAALDEGARRRSVLQMVAALLRRASAASRDAGWQLLPMTCCMHKTVLLPAERAALSDAASSDLLRDMSKAASRLTRQSHELAHRRELAAEKREAFEASHPDPFRKMAPRPAVSVSSVPQLEIRMFGGLEVSIDGKLVDPRLLSRRKTRTMASALALNKGQEMSRDKLCSVIWPHVTYEECKNSFYSIWASLKRALSYEGTCPYLIRTQTGCSLDARYLATDMEDFEHVCSSLVFGSGDMRSWEETYAKVTDAYSDILLPYERENPYINSIRERCESMMVDGLIAASSRLLDAGEVTGALWFSREALRRNDRREDVYISLVEAQIESNQRGPALETYFKCRKFLTEDLGIDPSPKLVGLYRSIIEYEEAI